MMTTATTRSIKPTGDISSVFAHLGARQKLMDPALLQLKKDITPKDKSLLNDAYERLLNTIKDKSKQVQELGSAIVPEVDFKDIQANGCALPEAVAEQVRERGCVVIRNVIPEDEARGYKEQLLEYIERHKDTLAGYPRDDPQIWEIYWSQPQVKARSHPRFNMATLALSKLWHASDDTVVDLTKNIGYCDRLRIRKPMDENFALREHIDSGSIERWLDPEYRKCYSRIFEGDWENYDPFDATHRVNARMDYYNSPGGCTAFRNFQGWLSISNVKPGGGTLRVCPLLKEAISYVVMRPLASDYIDKNDYCGAIPGLCQDIKEEYFPYIVNNMVSVPEVKPGDAVFWHCDQVHSVERKNESQVDSSVLYIPSVPLCRINSEYLKDQRHAFINGLTPPDFPGNHFERDFEDRGKPDNVDDNAKINMGLLPFPESLEEATAGQQEAIKIHNKLLGFA